MLIDTNIFIEICKNQKKGQVCATLLGAIARESVPEKIYMTKFSLDGMLAMLSHKYSAFLEDLLLLVHQDKIKIFDHRTEDNLMILSVKDKLDLDYDDACQFLATHVLGTYLVTYDKDFDKTDLPTKTPEEVIKALQS